MNCRDNTTFALTLAKNKTMMALKMWKFLADSVIMFPMPQMRLYHETQPAEECKETVVVLVAAEVAVAHRPDLTLEKEVIMAITHVATTGVETIVVEVDLVADAVNLTCD